MVKLFFAGNLVNPAPEFIGELHVVVTVNDDMPAATSTN